MKFKGFLIIISMIIFYMVNVSAQVISSEIEKQQKERIKLLKKEHKLTDVSVEISGNNNWLFKLKKKAFIGYNYGYADQNGKIILSPEYEEIVMKRNIDGFNYYEIKKSRNNIGVALTNGTIIIEPKYSDITYISRLDKEGSSNKIEVGNEMVETPYIWHKASDEIFICSDSYGLKEISLYTKEGKRIFNRKSEDWIGVVRVLRICPLA